MSWLSFLGFGRRGQDSLSRPPAQRIYIVDGTGLATDNRARNGSVHPSPRDHYLALRNMAQFAGRERIGLSAVFIGRPLREAGEGEDYKGVRVYYAEHAEAQAAKLLRLVKDNVRSKDVVLISGDAELEREALSLNAACLRLSTLRKAMDEREDRGERGERDGEHQPRYGRSRHPQQGRRQESERQEQQPAPASERRPEAERQPEPAQPSPVNEPKPAVPPAPERDRPEPGVLDLIDPM